MPLRWYKCKNESCRKYNHEFTIAYEDVDNTKVICPFCHQRQPGLTRLAQKEKDNRNKYGVCNGGI